MQEMVVLLKKFPLDCCWCRTNLQWGRIEWLHSKSVQIQCSINNLSLQFPRLEIWSNYRNARKRQKLRTAEILDLLQIRSQVWNARFYVHFSLACPGKNSNSIFNSTLIVHTKTCLCINYKSPMSVLNIAIGIVVSKVFFFSEMKKNS